MTKRMIIVGQGPAGLLSASLANARGWHTTIMGSSDGTLSLWSGSFDFVRFSEDGPKEPWRAAARLPVTLTKEEWVAGWQEFSMVLKGFGIPICEMSIENPRWTVNSAGRRKTVFLVPRWQYNTERAEPIWLIGFESHPDSIRRWSAEAYSQEIGAPCYFSMVGAPPGWDPHWNSIRYAAYLESDAGLRWLMGELLAERGGVPAGVPMVLPQVVGLKKPERLLAAISIALEREVYEYPLPPPSIGGMRIRDRWVSGLRRQGTEFIHGNVARVMDSATVSLTDGRSLMGDVLILATGGVLGGGLSISTDGTMSDSVLGVEVGLVAETSSPQDIFTMGSEANPLPDGPVFAVGRQRALWNPDRDDSGGAMVLATVIEALSAAEGQRIVSPTRNSQELSEGGASRGVAQ